MTRREELWYKSSLFREILCFLTFYDKIKITSFIIFHNLSGCRLKEEYIFMNVKVDALDKHKVALTIEVPSEEVGRGFRQAAAKIGRSR